MSSKNSPIDDKFTFDLDGILDELEQQLIENEKLQKENDVLKQENSELKAQLAKYQSPNIPSSKQLYPKKKMIRSTQIF